MKPSKIVMILALSAATQSAFAAGTTTGNLAVSATVSEACTIDSGTAMAFGTVTGISLTANHDMSGSLYVTCSNGTPYTISLDLGSNADTTTRRMVNGTTNFLTYELYSDAAGGVVWNSTSPPGGTADGTSTLHTIYGRIPAGQQTAMVGAYTDTVGITVTY